MEPYRESGYRRLMRMHVRNGDRGEAVRAYMECKRLLEAELGVAPSEETEALYREIAGVRPVTEPAGSTRTTDHGAL